MTEEKTILAVNYYERLHCASGAKAKLPKKKEKKTENRLNNMTRTDGRCPKQGKMEKKKKAFAHQWKQTLFKLKLNSYFL